MSKSNVRLEEKKQELQEAKDALARIAVRLVPQRVQYWILIRAGVKYIRSDEEVPAVPFTVVLSRFGDKRQENNGIRPMWVPRSTNAFQE
jgi:hypothetical protein